MPVEERRAAVTAILDSRGGRDGKQAAEDLLPILYDDLRRLAQSKLARESPGATLQPTDLVHESFMRLVDDKKDWNSKGHFFSAAAEAMRRILVERARARQSKKRGGDWQQTPLDGLADSIVDQLDMLALDESLEQLARVFPRSAEVVKLHAFTGLEFAEIAQILQVSKRSVGRDWRHAKAWLQSDLNKGRDGSEPTDGGGR